jgi:hypothetical protein
MITSNPEETRQHDLGESSVDGSMGDYFSPTALGSSEDTSASTFTGAKQYLENAIGEYPLAAIGVAVATGVVLGWLVKRR